jgi:hypothetical protein
VNKTDKARSERTHIYRSKGNMGSTIREEQAAAAAASAEAAAAAASAEAAAAAAAGPGVKVEPFLSIFEFFQH